MDQGGVPATPEESGQFVTSATEQQWRVWMALDGYHKGRWWERTARAAIALAETMPAMTYDQWEAIIDGLQAFIADEERRLAALEEPISYTG